MTAIIGHLSLLLAVLAAAGGLLASIASVRFDSLTYRRWSMRLVGVTFAGFTIASIALMYALVKGEFRFTYVAAYTDSVLPIGYRMAAFWAGQEGSLLLWAWLLGLLCVVAVYGYRKIEGAHMTIAFGVIAAVCGVFAAFLLFAANPFEIFPGPAPQDGRGLNPMLQDPAMMLHPPLLFLGYAAYTMPFAVLVGVLVTGRKDNRWLSEIRRWVIMSWVFLGAGIIVGGWWAYMELGWGGYWAWDPVENASLLPWLTGTALMHSIMVQQRRGMFKFWNAHLIWITFVLCIVGTYLTRSGVVDSVHSFAPSSLATFFLTFIGITTVFSLGLIFWRRRELKPENELDKLISREGAFLAANMLLLFMMFVTLIGTIFPVLTGLFGAESASAKPEFYNTIVSPMILLLVGVMAVAPVLISSSRNGDSAGRQMGRMLIAPGILAITVMLIAFALGMRNHWALLVAGIAALGTFTVIIGFVRSMSARRANTGESILTAACQLIDTDHRRYGGQLAHLGVMIMVIGVAGSSLYDSEEIYQLAPGESAVAGGYTFTYHGLREVPGPNYTAVQADISVVDSRGNSFTMEPQRRFFRNWEEKPHTAIALRSTIREDFYVALAGWEGGGKLTALKVKVNPLVVWLWIGSIVMGIGAIFCMLPRLTRRAQASRHQGVEASSERGAVASREAAFPAYTNGSPTRPRLRPATPDRTTPQFRPLQPTHSETEMTR
jgi:cytochrome c-type biogenesis protein CcmF